VLESAAGPALIGFDFSPKCLQKGVQVFSSSSVHAKFFIMDEVVVVGSTNISRHARSDLDDAAVMADDLPPFVQRLRAALAAHRHLRGDRVLYSDEGTSVKAKVLQNWMSRAQRRAGRRGNGAIHILRHTFCSQAMRGASALSIQRLAAHEDLQTTLGYMHLARVKRSGRSPAG
jgi:site-specific recombinase XerD